MGRRNKDLFKGQDVNTLTNTQGASAEAGASCFLVHRSTKAASRLQGPCGNSSAYWPSVLRYRWNRRPQACSIGQRDAGTSSSLLGEPDHRADGVRQPSRRARWHPAIIGRWSVSRCQPAKRHLPVRPAEVRGRRSRSLVSSPLRRAIFLDRHEKQNVTNCHVVAPIRPQLHP